MQFFAVKLLKYFKNYDILIAPHKILYFSAIRSAYIFFTLGKNVGSLFRISDSAEILCGSKTELAFFGACSFVLHALFIFRGKKRVMEVVAIVIGSIVMLVIVLGILSPFIINGTLALRDKFGKPTTPAKPPNQKRLEAPQQNGALFSPPYFNNLFARLSHFKEYGTHRYIDIIIYSLYKARLCATMFVSESNLDESVKHKVIDAYDTFQYLSLGGWMDKNAPAFTNKVDIADNRMMIYEKTLLGAQNSPLAMSILSRAFYWLLDNGWELDATGKQTTRPSSNYNFDAIQNMHEAERKYAPLQDEIELIVFSYCQRELPALITFFKNDFST